MELPPWGAGSIHAREERLPLCKESHCPPSYPPLHIPSATLPLSVQAYFKKPRSLRNHLFLLFIIIDKLTLVNDTQTIVLFMPLLNLLFELILVGESFI